MAAIQLCGAASGMDARQGEGPHGAGFSFVDSPTPSGVTPSPYAHDQM